MRQALDLNFVVRFGVFEANLSSGELRKNGVRVKIQELPFRALKLLLSRPNEVLSREQFRQVLWPEGVFVDFDHGISSAINRLRDALGDSADNPVFIETVERHGYRWIAPTHFPTPPVSPAPAPSNIQVHPPIFSPPRLRRSWVLIFPVIALLFAVWGLGPAYRAVKAAATKPHSSSPSAATAANHSRSEAEQFYLKGRFYWQKRTPDGLNRAVDSFTQAIIRDPNYAPAYVGLADCYNLLREYTRMPASEAYPRALAAARRAVQLDDQSSEAHASLGFAMFYGMWDAPNAEREFHRAIDLNPNNAVAHHWYATYLSAVGRHSEALAEIDRAQRLDPASKAVLADKGDLLWLAGLHDASFALLKQLAVAEPDFVSPHRYLETAYLARGDYAAYLSEWKQEATLMQDDSTLKVVETAQTGYATSGANGMLQSILASQKKLYDRGQFSPYLLAQTNSRLGNKEDALRYLKIAYEQHDERFVGLKGDSAFTNLRGDSAFQDLVARLYVPVHN